MKRIISVLLAVLITVCGCFCPANAYSAQSLALYEPCSGTVLESVNANVRMPMASTTKIMTALVTLKTVPLEQKVTVSAQAAGVEGSSMYLKAGETLTVSDLLYGLMLTSGNDAATALAIHISGSIEGFAKLMNEQAKALGLENTHFTNPSGLPDDDHYTTAYELAVIAAEAMKNPVFQKIVSSKTASVSGRTLTNHNKLLSMYEGAVGIKTGFTKKAGRCLVSAATRNGVTLICVTLKAPDDWNDHITALDRGFARTKNTCLAQSGSITVPLYTPDGKTVHASNRNTLYTVTTDAHDVTYTVSAEPFVYAPKTAGDKVGTVTYYVNGTTAASDDLVISCSLTEQVRKELLITRVINFIKNIFKKEL